MNKFSSKFRKGVIGMAAAVGTLGAVTTLDTSPASAATSVTFCFDFQNPPVFSDYASKPVFLYDQLPHGEWRLLRQGWTNASGCGTFYNTNPTVPMLLKAYTTTAYQTWESPYYTVRTGSGAVNMGTLPVFRTR